MFPVDLTVRRPPKFLSDFARRRVFNGELKMTDSQKLLAEYARHGSENAFRELVTRYMDLVYSTAVRLADGDTHAAQDIAQTVFCDLARLAPRLSSQVRLGGWLHRHTCFTAAKIRRADRRRQAREKEAAEMSELDGNPNVSIDRIAPVLDDAIDHLSEADRAAILLRFFEQRDFRSVGAELGASEAAAQKRVGRALEKLHKMLTRRGAACTSAALAAVLAGEAVAASPAGLAAAITGTALANAATSSASAITILKFMALPKLKLTLVGALVASCVLVPTALQHHAQSKLQRENDSLRARLAELTGLRAENQRLAGLITQAKDSAALTRDQFSELLKLRAEVSRLRQPQSWPPDPKPAAERMSDITVDARTPEDATKDNSIPKESWAFAGYATPEAALQTVMWAMSKGDVKAFFASLTPEALALASQEFAGKSDAEIAAALTHETANIGGLRPDQMKTISDREVSFVVYSVAEDDGAVRKRDESVVKFKNVAGDWKFSGL